jgi:predicted MFS family arabinose efflux permease
LATIGWAQVQTLAGFYGVWAAIGVINAMILYEPAFAVTAVWFVRRRRQALTLLTLGGGLASVIFVPLATWLVQLYGWRAALWVLAVILAVTTIPLHALVLRRGPEALNTWPDGEPPPTINHTQQSHPTTEPAHGLTVGVAMRQQVFWWLSLAFGLSTFAAVALAVYLLPFLTAQGYASGFAALTASILGGSQIPGRLIFGPVGNRLSLRLVTAILFAMMMLGLLILLLAPTRWLILLGAALFGMGSGASSPARAALVGEVYGIAHYGAINGVMTLVLTLARSAAPVALGLLYSWTGGYTALFAVLIVSAGIAVGAILATHRVG